MSAVAERSWQCACGFDEALFTTPEFYQDQYPPLDELRETCAVHASGLLQGWLLTRYDDVDRCLRDTSTFSSAQNQARKIERLPEHLRERARPITERMDSTSLLMQDPPRHTAQRRLLARAFVPGHVQALEGTVRAMARDLLQAALARGRMDFETEIARPLPGMVLAHFLGVPDADRAKFVEWGNAAAAISVAAKPDETVVDAAATAFVEMGAYVEGLLEDRVAADDSRSDFLSFVATLPEGSLSRDEVVGSCIQLLYAGHETSTVTMSIGVYNLLRHPDQWALLRSRPELLPTAVEEILRFEPPVIVIPARTATRDVEIDGVRISAGDAVFCAIGIANRDPRLFDRPTDFDISRSAARRHLDFGAGPHLCLGAPIARMEIRILLQELTAAFPELRFDPDRDVVWRQLFSLRKLDALPLVW